MTYTSTNDSGVVHRLLGKLAAWAGQKIFLIADRLWRASMAKRGRRVGGGASRPDRTVLLALATPRERNPDEYLNNDLKGGVNKTGLPHTKQDLRSRIQAFMHRLWHLPEHVRSYFQHPSVQYAAGL